MNDILKCLSILAKQALKVKVKKHKYQPRLEIGRQQILVFHQVLANVGVANQERILNHCWSQKNLTLIVIIHHLTLEWQQKFDQIIQL